MGQPQTPPHPLTLLSSGSERKPFNTLDIWEMLHNAVRGIEKPQDKEAKKIYHRDLREDIILGTHHSQKLMQAPSQLNNIRTTLGNNLNLLNILLNDPSTPKSLKDPMFVEEHQKAEQTFNDLQTKIDRAAEERDKLKKQYKQIVALLGESMGALFIELQQGKSPQDLKEQLNNLKKLWDQGKEFNKKADEHFKEQNILEKELRMVHKKLLSEASRFESLQKVLESLPDEKAPRQPGLPVR